MNKEEVKIDCPNCPAFGMHCPHIMNGDPYYYNCTLTVAVLEKENTELKVRLNAINLLTPELEKASELKRKQLTKAKELPKGE